MMTDTTTTYLGLDGFALAKQDCAADQACKSIVDVSKALGYEKLNSEFMMCKSAADELVDSDNADVFVKGN